MWLRVLLCLAGAILSASPALAETASRPCDLSGIKDVRELETALQNRAIEAIKLAASGGETAHLQQLVDLSAKFSSGGGDVGFPLGKGVAGIRALAKHMKADRYRTFDWGGMPYPISNTCGPQETSVEFTNISDRESFEVKFKFNAGRIVSAETWSRSFSTGDLGSVHK
jgi:hypothetical protein